MVHKERQGFFPNEEEKLATDTAPNTLGLSLLNASVKERTGEVVINELPSVNKKVDPEKKPINYNNLDWAFK